MIPETSFQWFTSGDDSAMYASCPADCSRCNIMSKMDFHSNAHDSDASVSSVHNCNIVCIVKGHLTFPFSQFLRGHRRTLCTCQRFNLITCWKPDSTCWGHGRESNSHPTELPRGTGKSTPYRTSRGTSGRRTHALPNKPARLSLHCSSEIAKPLSHGGRFNRTITVNNIRVVSNATTVEFGQTCSMPPLCRRVQRINPNTNPIPNHTNPTTNPKPSRTDPTNPNSDSGFGQKCLSHCHTHRKYSKYWVW